jgi:hypothetical protein
VSNTIFTTRNFLWPHFGYSSNAALDLEIPATGTQFEADLESRQALETLFDGHKWAIYANSLTKVLHFDFVRISFSTGSEWTLTTFKSVIGRMISFPVADNQ